MKQDAGFRCGARVFRAGGALTLLLLTAGCLPRAAAKDRPPLPVAARPPGPVRLLAVGDIMIGSPGWVARIREKGARAPFLASRPLLNGADLTFGNLETPLSERGKPTAGKSPASLKARTNFLFRGPTSAAAGLAWAGFDVLSLANNHAMDYRKEALLDTVAALREADLLPVGAGVDLAAAGRSVVVERNGQRFRFFAISDILPLYSAAGPRVAGVAPARRDGFEKAMKRYIRAARAAGEWVLVSVHWGKERQRESTPRQRRLGRSLIDWGAHVVIGHHTHVLGEVEQYKKGWIHYSLGNFVGPWGKRADVGVWEVVFQPGSAIRQRLVMRRWDGSPRPRARPARKPRR